MVKIRDEAAKVSGQAVELSEAFHTPMKQKQEALTKRARDQLMQSNEARAAKRRVSVSAAGVVVQKTAATAGASASASVPVQDSTKATDGQ